MNTHKTVEVNMDQLISLIKEGKMVKECALILKITKSTARYRVQELIKTGRLEPIPKRGWNKGNTLSKETQRCIQCGIDFFALKGRKFCSKKCSVLAITKRNLEPIICPVCSKSFTRSRVGDRVYCSKGCSQIAHLPNMQNMALIATEKYTLEMRSTNARAFWRTDKPRFLQIRIDNGSNGKIAEKARIRFQDPEFKKKHSDALKASMTEKRKSEISERMKHFVQYSMRRCDTKPELKFETLLAKLSIAYIKQYLIGGYAVDFYLPEFNRYIEIHGDYWHQNPKIYGLNDPSRNKVKATLANDKNKAKWLKNEYGITLDIIWESDNYEEKLKEILKLSPIFETNNKEESFVHYKELGFPFYTCTANEIVNNLGNLKNISKDKIISQDGIKIDFKAGNRIIYHFFPNFFEEERVNFNQYLEKVINNRLQYKGRVNDRILLKGFKISGLVQGYSLFLPSIAKAIVEEYCPKGGTVYDPFAGWGARLMGTVLNDCFYYGVDKGYRTCCNNITMARYFGWEDKIRIINQKSEDYRPDQPIDLIFSCPPYYNIEKYEGDKFESFDSYLKILDQSINNGLRKLKPNGKVILVLSDKFDYTNLFQRLVLKLVNKLPILNPTSHFGSSPKESAYILTS